MLPLSDAIVQSCLTKPDECAVITSAIPLSVPATTVKIQLKTITVSALAVTQLFVFFIQRIQVAYFDGFGASVRLVFEGAP